MRVGGGKIVMTFDENASFAFRAVGDSSCALADRSAPCVSAFRF